MAIYRPPKPRWPLAVATAFVGLLIGFGIGFAIGDKDPDPTEVADGVRAELVAAAGSLEVAQIEYEESVSDGEVTRQAEYEGAIGAVESSEARFEGVAAAVEALAPERAAEIEVLYEECADDMSDRVDSSEVARCLDELRVLLEGET